MRFQAGKSYRTRGGHRAVIYAVYSKQGSLHGAVQRTSDSVWMQHNWDLSGMYEPEKGIHFQDLIDTWKEGPIEVYAVVADDGSVLGWHRNRENADIACKSWIPVSVNARVVLFREVVEGN